LNLSVDELKIVASLIEQCSHSWPNKTTNNRKIMVKDQDKIPPSPKSNASPKCGATQKAGNTEKCTRTKTHPEIMPWIFSSPKFRFLEFGGGWEGVDDGANFFVEAFHVKFFDFSIFSKTFRNSRIRTI
jgi:hypothetical protein